MAKAMFSSLWGEKPVELCSFSFGCAVRKLFPGKERVYDPAEHDGVAFEDLPDDWKCPRCRQSKEKFNRA